MARSTQRYTVVGTPLALLDLNISYFDRSEITVFFNGVISPVGTLWQWSGTSGKRILFTPAVALGVTVLVKRTTDTSKIRHAYSQGAAFTAATLDEDLTQVLHIAQEATESSLSLSYATIPEAIAGVDPNGIMAPSTTHTAVRAVLSQVYPIGSIYISTISANPRSLFGFGTWTVFGAGRTLVSLNSANALMDTVEKTFGQTDQVNVAHTHSVYDPGHLHNMTDVASAVFHSDADISSPRTVDVNRNYVSRPTGVATTNISINWSGSSGADMNYQPSIAVYMWKRTT